MMSVIVEDENGHLYVFSKGADSAIFSLINDADRIGAEFKKTSDDIE